MCIDNLTHKTSASCSNANSLSHALTGNFITIFCKVQTIQDVVNLEIDSIVYFETFLRKYIHILEQTLTPTVWTNIAQLLLKLVYDLYITWFLQVIGIMKGLFYLCVLYFCRDSQTKFKCIKNTELFFFNIIINPSNCRCLPTMCDVASSLKNIYKFEKFQNRNQLLSYNYKFI